MPNIAATVTINKDRCKGCVLCVVVCPPQVLHMSKEFNTLGYHYPLLSEGCTGCEHCFRMCPDYVFEVYRGSVR